ncbi:MAG: hypothetical protein F4213_03360 [Boseongicola sp. SB0677_bin_26]|nr:hypothetical protein [Boseongicola sp. SB0665_bin_10]MYG25053.1 hypothetical protein [Boseongicola sp. SB0677_bin_26]
MTSSSPPAFKGMWWYIKVLVPWCLVGICVVVILALLFLTAESRRNGSERRSEAALDTFFAVGGALKEIRQAIDDARKTGDGSNAR